MSVTQENLIQYIHDDLGVGELSDANTELFTEGLLDSVSMVNLIAYIEEKAKIIVQPSDVTLENFNTVARIVDYLHTLI